MFKEPSDVIETEMQLKWESQFCFRAVEQQALSSDIYLWTHKHNIINYPGL